MLEPNEVCQRLVAPGSHMGKPTHEYAVLKYVREDSVRCVEHGGRVRPNA